MAVKKKGFTEALFATWIKEGRGSGEQADYKPWLTVRDLPSLGRVHRVFGHKSRRTHHLLSDLELAFFLLLEWHSEVIQIHEQFPLERDTTRRLAIEAGIKHSNIVRALKRQLHDEAIQGGSDPRISECSTVVTVSRKLLKAPLEHQ